MYRIHIKVCCINTLIIIWYSIHPHTTVHTCKLPSTPAHTYAHSQTPKHTHTHLCIPVHILAHLLTFAHISAHLCRTADTYVHLRIPKFTLLHYLEITLWELISKEAKYKKGKERWEKEKVRNKTLLEAFSVLKTIKMIFFSFCRMQ